MTKNITISMALACCLYTHAGLQAQTTKVDSAELDAVRETTDQLIEMLIESGVLTQEKARSILNESRKRAQDARKAGPAQDVKQGPVRVPYVPKSVREDLAREVREQVKKELAEQAADEGWGSPNAVPGWLDRLKFEGALRLRFQQDMFADDNAPAAFFQAGGADVDNTTESRARLRFRARLGLLASVAPEWSAGLRFSSGSTRDPVSTNQSYGQYGSSYAVVIDRAFLKYDRKDSTTVWAGRIPNPWFRSDLVWDEDLHFEGIAANWRTVGQGRTFKPYLTLGGFTLQEVQMSARDKWLYGAQAGFDWDPSTEHQFRLGVAFYEYVHEEGRRNAFPGASDTDYTAPQFKQFGNSLFNIDPAGDDLFALASQYRNVNVTAAWNFNRFDPVGVSLMSDYVRNIGFDQAEIRQRTGLTPAEDVNGYQLRLQVGHARVHELGQWQVHLAYKHLEADAVLDAFTDSDFHLGGTNAKGFILGGSIGLAARTTLGVRWLSANQITGDSFKVDVFQLDLSAEF